MANQPESEDPHEAMLAGLRKALAYHRDPDSKDGGRLAAIVALDAVADYLHSIPEVRQDELHSPLANLKLALQDYEAGLSPGIFRRANTTGRNRDPTEWEVVKAAAALAMAWLMQGGDQRMDAARWVANQLQARGWKLRGRDDKQIRASTVARWRDDAEAGLPSEDLDADLYRDLKASPEIFGISPKSAATKLLDWLHSRFPPDHTISG